jgi:hypothetical protein
MKFRILLIRIVKRLLKRQLVNLKIFLAKRKLLLPKEQLRSLQLEVVPA